MKNNVHELGCLLGELKKEGETPEIKEKIKNYLKKVTPLELASAEQALIKDGLDTEELRGLCQSHLEFVREDEDLKARLEPGHFIHTLVSEHERILDFIFDLEVELKKLEKKDKIETSDLESLQDIAHHLAEAEAHHEREEKVLFPKLEEKGISAPPEVMRIEHEELRKKKKNLLKMTESFESFSLERIKKLSHEIIFQLREHIFKENNILYPAALEVIKDSWREMKEEGDKIGYCCFTPKK